jgi:hypothetical protein
MQVDVVNSVVINRPVPDVFQYAADPDKAPLWYVNIKSVEWKTPSPDRVTSGLCRAFPGSPVGVHVRIRGVLPRQAIDEAHTRTTVPDGDDLHVGGRGRCHANDAPQPRHAERIRHLARSVDVVHDWKSKQEGSGVTQATS